MRVASCIHHHEPVRGRFVANHDTVGNQVLAKCDNAVGWRIEGDMSMGCRVREEAAEDGDAVRRHVKETAECDLI